MMRSSGRLRKLNRDESDDLIDDQAQSRSKPMISHSRAPSRRQTHQELDDDFEDSEEFEEEEVPSSKKLRKTKTRNNRDQDLSFWLKALIGIPGSLVIIILQALLFWSLIEQEWAVVVEAQGAKSGSAYMIGTCILLITAIICASAAGMLSKNKMGAFTTAMGITCIFILLTGIVRNVADTDSMSNSLQIAEIALIPGFSCHDRALQRTKAQAAKDKSTLEANIKNLKETHQQEVTTLNTNMTEQKQSHEKAVADLEKSHSNTVSEMNTSHETAIEEQKNKLTDEKNEVQKELEELHASVKTQIKDAEEAKVKERNAQFKEFMTKYVRSNQILLEEKLAEQKNDYEKVLVIQEKKYTEKVRELTAKIRAQMRK